MSSSLMVRSVIPSGRVLVISPSGMPINCRSLSTIRKYCSSSGLHSAGWTYNDPRNYLKLSSISPKERPQIRTDSSQDHIQVDHFKERDSKGENISDFIAAAWTFIRPTALLYYAWASLTIAARVWIENPHLIKWSTPVVAIIMGAITLWFSFGFVNGLNQIYDLDIDRINKPDLPLASGAISLKSVWVVTIYFGALGLSTVVLNKMGPVVTSIYVLYLLTLGVFYSAPPFRFKRFPATAMLSIVSARFLFNFGVYYATRVSIGLPFKWSPGATFIVIMPMMNALVGSIAKDIPDIEGDRMYGVHTLASKIGARNVAFLSTGLLLLSYIAAICTAIFMPQAFKRSIMIPIHAILALVLIYKTWILENANYSKEASTAFYRVLWKLAGAECTIFPFI